MGLYEKMEKATADRDAEAYIDLMHDDFQFVRHQTGTTMNREESAEMIRAMMGTGAIAGRDGRKIYENDDIMVAHSLMDFPDGTTEAVMSVNLLKDGKVIRLETGATPIKS